MTAFCSEEDRFNCRGAPSIIYVEITLLISSRNGWIVTDKGSAIQKSFQERDN